MNRTELERLDRDTLIAHAEAGGVTRARILTRPELIDELLVRGARSSDDAARVRGFFGRARDLLARVIERGLHLPDAADRFRTRSQPPPPLRSTAAPLPTVTLAEIYAAQGHRDRAVETLRNVLSREPEHAAARTLIEQLEDAAYQGPAPPTLPPEDEIFAAGRGAESERPAPPKVGKPKAPARPGTKHGVDECVAFPADPETLFVYWDVSDRAREHLEATRPGGVITLRVLLIEPTWEGPESIVRDLEVHALQGDSLMKGIPEGVLVRVAVGWSLGGEFIPVAHSPALETQRSETGAVPGSLVRWTLRGAVPLGKGDRDADSIERAFGAARAKERGVAQVESETRG